MAVIFYGTKTFTKFVGYFGEKEECEACHKTYKKAYVRNKVWAHLNDIPHFPMKTFYNKSCPICGHGYSMKNKEAKLEMENSFADENQKIEIYAKHILAKKPKRFLDADMSYEIYAKDLISGEETLIATNISKDVVKSIKKDRGLKTVQIIDV